jgi:hypothetical protein
MHNITKFCCNINRIDGERYTWVERVLWLDEDASKFFQPSSVETLRGLGAFGETKQYIYSHRKKKKKIGIPLFF